MKSLIVWLLFFFPQATIDIKLEANAAFRIVGLPGAPPESVTVFVDSPGTSDLPALSGRTTRSGKDLLFVPRYPLTPGLRYNVEVRIPGRETVVRSIEIPGADLTPTTTIEHVYPSTDRLPENQLKFYVQFSAPMSRGEAYHRIHLLDESGKPVAMPFLELEQELWDLPGQRLTLFFDPGRIKRDVLPNQEMGPSIVSGRRYTLVIDQNWKDADGRQLKAEFRKSFSVGDADRKPLDIGSWKTSAPPAGTTDVLNVDFPEPLDHALLLGQFDVLDPAGNIIEGTVSTDRDETRWVFKPSRPWKSGSYGLRVGTVISDLAGNMVDRPFEIDRFDTVTERIARETRVIPFTIR